MSQEVVIEDWEAHARLVFEQLNEKQRRWVAGLLSELLGWGGTKRVANATGVDPKTIRKGRRDLDQQLAPCPVGRVRREGAGRPPLKKRSGD